MNQPALIGLPSCADAADPGSLPVETARHRILDHIQPISESEALALRSALGRVLADDARAPIDVPAQTNSAMDGYALRGADLDGRGAAELRLVGEAFAGRPYPEAVAAGECVRIMTGAPMPRNCDTVVMQEKAQARASRVLMAAGQRRGQNVRQAGEDLSRGEVALPAGRRLTAADLGLLASMGQAEVRVRRRPRVAFFSTGDELCSVGDVLADGQIYDSNRYSLFGMLQGLGVEARDLGVVPDDRAALRTALLEASRDCDMVLTSGGVSVGEADHVKRVLCELGSMAFWKIAMKPGRPLAFGQLGPAWFFGLPGNPVAVMVTFYQFVQPALRRLMGESTLTRIGFRAQCLEHIAKRPGRTEFLRGTLKAGDGSSSSGPQVRRAGSQGSGILKSMSLANCFIVLPPDCDGVAAGDDVLVQPFEGLF